MKQSTQRVGGVKSTTKSSKVLTGKTARERAYQMHFTPMVVSPDTEGFFKQVNGFGTPVYSEVRSFAGV